MLIIIGITGASGAIYGIRLLQALSDMKEVETHLIVTAAGAETVKHETDWELNQVYSLADYYYDIDEIGARLASGSVKRDGMIIAPCTMKTMSAIANAYTDNLLIRAADVTLKERKKLVLLTRETPLHLGHIRNMEKVTEMGGIILPPIPAFYHKPQTIEDIIDQTVGKVLDIFDIDYSLYRRWQGLKY